MSTLPDAPLTEIPTVEVLETPDVVTSESNALGAEATVNTAMLAEILAEQPFWRRPNFLAAAGAAFVLSVGLYAINSESSEETAPSAALEQADEATFAADAKSAEPEASVAEQLLSRYAVSPADKVALEKIASDQATSVEKSVKTVEKPATTVESQVLPSEKAGPMRFAVNSTKLDQKTKRTLTSMAQRMRANHSMKLRIEGYADERGTLKYNYRLGLLRAKAAKQFLVKNGVAANRLRVVSYGKTRPVVRGAGEKAWAKNRRVEFKEATMLLSRR